MKTKDLIIGETYAVGSGDYGARYPYKAKVLATDVSDTRWRSGGGKMRTTGYVRVEVAASGATDLVRPAEIRMLWSEWEPKAVELAQLDASRRDSAARYGAQVQAAIDSLGLKYAYLVNRSITVPASEIIALAERHSDRQSD